MQNAECRMQNCGGVFQGTNLLPAVAATYDKENAMKHILITPQKNCLLIEITEKASDRLNSIIEQIEWLKWKKMKDVNGKTCQRWYIVVDTSIDKGKRLSQFAKYLCVVEGFTPSSRICPHDLYYEDYVKYFEAYK